MPYGNGKGPRGEGPMTGRQQGNCAQGTMRDAEDIRETSGYLGRGFFSRRGVFGRGRGRGFQAGIGRGFWERGFRGRGMGIAEIISEDDENETN